MNKQLIAAIVMAFAGTMASSSALAIITGNGGTENGTGGNGTNLNGTGGNGTGGNGTGGNGTGGNGTGGNGREHQSLSTQGRGIGSGMNTFGSKGALARLHGQAGQAAADQTPNLDPRLDAVLPAQPTVPRWIELRNGVKYMLD